MITPVTRPRAPKPRRPDMPLVRFLLIAAGLLCACSTVLSQKLPGSIRGYKVHTAKIFVATSEASLPRDHSKYDAVILMGEAKLQSLGFSGVQLRAPLEIRSSKVTGEIEFISFNDFTIDGSSISVTEIREGLKLPKKASYPIRKVSTVGVSGPGILKAGLRTATGAAKNMTIRGTVFVFGRFDKLGMKFKRVIPVKINASIPNPLVKP